jgi:hypothetical protein
VHSLPSLSPFVQLLHGKTLSHFNFLALQRWHDFVARARERFSSGLVVCGEEGGFGRDEGEG